MIKLLSLAAVSALSVSAPPALSSPPDQYPTFSHTSATPLVIVATIRPGEYLPEFPRCADPDVLCMDPPPFWFHATVSTVVLGSNLPDRLHVSTTSHYGMGELEFYDAEPMLISLLTDAEEFVMPRYAMTGLVEDLDGDLHLLVTQTAPLWWLPCSVSELREELDPANFPTAIEIPNDDPWDGVEEDPELFLTTPTGAVPRFTIPVAKIRAHLNSITLTSEQMTCKAE